MTVDEALTYSESFDPATIDRGGSIQEAFLELAAEVRRLRAENAELQSQRDTALENYAEQKAIYEGLCK